MKRKVLSLMLSLCMVFSLMVVSAYAADPSVSGEDKPGGNITPSNPVTPPVEEVTPPVEEEHTHDTSEDLGLTPPAASTTPSTPPAAAAPSTPDKVTVVPATDIKATAPTDVSKLPEKDAANYTAALEVVNHASSAAELLKATGLETTVKAVLAEISLPSGNAPDVEDMKIAGTTFISSEGEAAAAIARGETVEITFEMDGISDGDTVVVLVYDGAAWTQVPAVVRGGKIVGQFKVLGTVVVMKADEAADSGLVTSPQTSGANLEGVMLIFGAVLSLAVLVLCMKRSRMTA